MTLLDDIKAVHDEVNNVSKAKLSQVITEHPDLQIDKINPRVFGSIPQVVGTCPQCGDDMFDSLDKTGKPIQVCRNTINAIRLDSIKHKPSNQSDELCIDCQIITDEFGFITGANHITRSIEDKALSWGIWKGIKTLIAANQIQLKQGKVIINES